jgi:two-component system response regulator FixJ
MPFMAGSPNPRIYLVDDDSSVRKALHRLLASAGRDVSSFASAREFLETVPLETEGILVLDLRMPEMDGFELHRRLAEANSPLKVILITAFVQPGDSERGIRQGAVGFLVKPFDEAELLALIEESSAA